MGAGPVDQDQYYFVQTSFYLEMHKDEFKNLIRTSKFKFSAALFTNLLEVISRKTINN
jgi:hypothetical protein